MVNGKLCLLLTIVIINLTLCKHVKKTKYRTTTTPNPFTRRVCLDIENSLRAKHQSCFLRPDTGPCRADIVQYYFDVKARRCYRFFWGGCQGNGNRFETYKECFDSCYLNTSFPHSKTPYYCALAFDYGNCFGYYTRWTWDRYEKTCKRRLYSGCGGNQNNFETVDECFATCRTAPIDTLNKFNQYTTCIPYVIPGVS